MSGAESTIGVTGHTRIAEGRMLSERHRRNMVVRARVQAVGLAILIAFLVTLLTNPGSQIRAQSNTAPEFPASETGRRAMNENTADGTNIGSPVAATDSDNDSLTYSIDSEGEAVFELVASTGQLRTKAPLNYEGASSYTFTLSVHDGKDSSGEQDTSIDDTITVMVAVTNVDEPGVITLSSEKLRVGVIQRARVIDPDGNVRNESWRWEQQSGDKRTWIHLDQVRGPYYTPDADSEGKHLRIYVNYGDGAGRSGGFNGSASFVSSAPVLAKEAPNAIRVVELVEGLNLPWDLDFAPDGTMLVAELKGTLRAYLANGTSTTVTADRHDLFPFLETGLMSIVIDPGFSTNRRFYTCQGHYLSNPGDRIAFEVQVIAWTMNEDYSEAVRVDDPLVGGIPLIAITRNNGCRLRFGPDGYLWIATGDASRRGVSQDLDSLGGKILRVDSSTGEAAPGNPFNSRVYTYGHRKVQGLALHPGTQQVWAVEYGPGFDDEINLLTSGGNYGWDPGTRYHKRVPMTNLLKFPDAVQARWSSGPSSLGASGGVFLEGVAWDHWNGRLAVTSLGERSLRLFEFDGEGRLQSEVVVPGLRRTYGRLRSPVLGPDGILYVTTSNGGNRDKILKVVPGLHEGKPTIRGTTHVGETLTADTSDIADPDGLTNPTFTHQWIRSDGTTDIDIAGAAGSTYVVATDDVGKTIKVRVSFTDVEDNAESLTSEGITALAITVPGAPRSVAVERGGTGELVVTWQAPSSNGGSDITGYRVQWKEATGSWDTPADVSETTSTGTSHTITSLSLGTEYSVRVIATNPVGDGPASPEVKETADAATSLQRAATENSPAIGAPSIGGTAQVGETLTADTSSIADADGLNDVAFNYQWVRNDGNADTNIQGATDSTYFLVSDDASKTIKVRVSFTDDAGYNESLTSPPTAVVEDRPNRPATGQPTISGKAQVGETLTAGTSRISDTDGLDDAAFSYQWLSDDAAIAGAADSTYTPEAADEGRAIRVRVSFNDDRGHEETLTSDATAAVSPEQNRDTADRPHGLSASVEAGAVVLTWNAPDDDGGVTMYRILRHRPEEGETEPLVYVDFTRSRATTYTDTAVEPGTLYVYGVQAVDTFGLAGEASNPVEVRMPATNIPATGAPTISGEPQVGETLTADTSDIADENGLDNASFSYQWVSYDGNADTDIPGAAGSTYTLVPEDEGRAFRVRVSFTDDDGHRESLTSALARSERPYALSASASDGAVALTWKLPVGWPYSSTFQILRNRPELGEAEPLVLVKYLQAPGNAHTDTDVAAGVLYVYRVKGVDPFGYPLEASQPVEIRAEAAVADNNPASGAPTISGTAQVGETLTADTSGIDDEDGLDNAAFDYQWLADDAEIEDATASTYTLAAADEGKTIKVKVSFTDDNSNDESLTSAATGAVAAAPPTNNEATGAPAISGTVKVGHVLTADMSGIADQDGLDNVSFSYQWLRDDGSTDVGIAGETNSAYVVDTDDEGKAIKVRVSFTDDAGNEETLTSAPTAQVASTSNHPATGLPAIRGQARVGATLRVSLSSLDDADGLSGTIFSYQWLADDADTQDATNSTYVLDPDDEGKAIRVRVIFTDDAGNEETLTSAPTAQVVPTSNNPATGLPVIRGQVRVGATLRASLSILDDPDGLSGATFTYQWLADDAEIRDATDSTYVLDTNDEGKTIRVRVSFTDAAGNEETLTSVATSVVAPR